MRSILGQIRTNHETALQFSSQSATRRPLYKPWFQLSWPALAVGYGQSVHLTVNMKYGSE